MSNLILKYHLVSIIPECQQVHYRNSGYVHPDLNMLSLIVLHVDEV